MDESPETQRPLDDPTILTTDLVKEIMERCDDCVIVIRRDDPKKPNHKPIEIFSPGSGIQGALLAINAAHILIFDHNQRSFQPPSFS